MKVFYRYRDKLFEDIREIVDNNRKKLTPNWEYIFFEYLPYQVFITGRTFFREVYIEPNCRYDREDQHYGSIDLKDVFDQYLEEHDFDSTNYTAAVSGGTDSSSVATIMKPKHIYSGFYDDPNCDERPYAIEVADRNGLTYHPYLMTEQTYIWGIDEFLEAICSPIAGMGGVSEYLVLKKALSETKADSVFFGNGGDEVFCGYFYNHIIAEMIKEAEAEHQWMNNFAPARKKFVYDNINNFINLLNYRGVGTPDRNPFERVKGDWIDRLLTVNINYTLPSLLHVVQQICKANNVRGFNPLSSEILIKHAKQFNTPFSEEPKKKLKELVDLPALIVNRKDKMGFPIPIHKWNELNVMMRDAFKSFVKFVESHNYGFYEIKDIYEPYNGINRRTWGIFMIERWRRLFA